MAGKLQFSSGNIFLSLTERCQEGHVLEFSIFHLDDAMFTFLKMCVRKNYEFNINLITEIYARHLIPKIPNYPSIGNM